jgi:hypothetical protein
MKITMNLNPRRTRFPVDGALSFALALHVFRNEAADEFATRKRERAYDKARQSPSPSRGIPA